MYTLPGRCLWSQPHPHVCTLSQVLLPIWAQYPPHPRGSAGRPGGEDTGATAAGEFPKVPWSVFFLRNPPAQSCHSIQGRACPLTQPTSPARPGTFRVRTPHSPTLNSPQLAPTVSVGLPLCPYSPPCDSSNQISLGAAQALFGRGGSH